jgi:hypothetical protein
MKPKPTKRLTPKPKPMGRGRDRERVKAESIEAMPQFWAIVRDSYPESVRSIVDRLAIEKTVVTLADLKLLAVATERHIAARAEETYAEHGGSRTYAQFASVQLQFQKHIRHICALEGPGLGLGDQPVVVPQGMSPEAFAGVKQALVDDPDEIMS